MEKLYFLEGLLEDIDFRRDETVGFAFLELDCGCMRGIRFSADGEPIYPFAWLQINEENTSICEKCNEDQASSCRAIDGGIVWSVNEDEMPNEDQRILIKNRYFNYDAPEYKIIKD